MFTLGDVADILDNALDTGISIVDALWKLSECADDGVLNRDQCYERLNLNDSSGSYNESNSPDHLGTELHEQAGATSSTTGNQHKGEKRFTTDDNDDKIVDHNSNVTESLEDKKFSSPNTLIEHNDVFTSVGDRKDNISSIVFRSSRGRSSVEEKTPESTQQPTDDLSEKKESKTDRVAFKLEIRKVSTSSPIKIVNRSLGLSELNIASKKSEEKFSCQRRNTFPSETHDSVPDNHTELSLSHEEDDHIYHKLFDIYDNCTLSSCHDGIDSKTIHASKQPFEKDIAICFKDACISETYDNVSLPDLNNLNEDYGLFDDERQTRKRRERPNTFTLNNTMIPQEAEVIGLPIIQALDDLCKVADELLAEYKSAKEGEYNADVQKRQDQPDGTVDNSTDDDIVQISDDLVEDNLQDIGLQATEVLNSFKRMQEGICSYGYEIPDNIMSDRREHTCNVDKTSYTGQANFSGDENTHVIMNNACFAGNQPRSNSNYSHNDGDNNLSITKLALDGDTSSGKDILCYQPYRICSVVKGSTEWGHLLTYISNEKQGGDNLTIVPGNLIDDGNDTYYTESDKSQTKIDPYEAVVDKFKMTHDTSSASLVRSTCNHSSSVKTKRPGTYVLSKESSIPMSEVVNNLSDNKTNQKEMKHCFKNSHQSEKGSYVFMIDISSLDENKLSHIPTLPNKTNLEVDKDIKDDPDVPISLNTSVSTVTEHGLESSNLEHRPVRLNKRPGTYVLKGSGAALVERTSELTMLKNSSGNENTNETSTLQSFDHSEPDEKENQGLHRVNARPGTFVIQSSGHVCHEQRSDLALPSAFIVSNDHLVSTDYKKAGDKILPEFTVDLFSQTEPDSELKQRSSNVNLDKPAEHKVGNETDGNILLSTIQAPSKSELVSIIKETVLEENRRTGTFALTDTEAGSDAKIPKSFENRSPVAFVISSNTDQTQLAPDTVLKEALTTQTSHLSKSEIKDTQKPRRRKGRPGTYVLMTSADFVRNQYSETSLASSSVEVSSEVPTSTNPDSENESGGSLSQPTTEGFCESEGNNKTEEISPEYCKNGGPGTFGMENLKDQSDGKLPELSKNRSPVGFFVNSDKNIIDKTEIASELAVECNTELGSTDVKIPDRSPIAFLGSDVDQTPLVPSIVLQELPTVEPFHISESGSKSNQKPGNLKNRPGTYVLSRSLDPVRNQSSEPPLASSTLTTSNNHQVIACANNKNELRASFPQSMGEVFHESERNIRTEERSSQESKNSVSEIFRLENLDVSDISILDSSKNRPPLTYFIKSDDDIADNKGSTKKLSVKSTVKDVTDIKIPELLTTRAHVAFVVSNETDQAKIVPNTVLKKLSTEEPTHLLKSGSQKCAKGNSRPGTYVLTSSVDPVQKQSPTPQLPLSSYSLSITNDHQLSLLNSTTKGFYESEGNSRREEISPLLKGNNGSGASDTRIPKSSDSRSPVAFLISSDNDGTEDGGTTMRLPDKLPAEAFNVSESNNKVKSTERIKRPGTYVLKTSAQPASDQQLSALSLSGSHLVIGDQNEIVQEANMKKELDEGVNQDISQSDNTIKDKQLQQNGRPGTFIIENSENLFNDKASCSPVHRSPLAFTISSDSNESIEETHAENILSESATKAAVQLESNNKVKQRTSERRNRPGTYVLKSSRDPSRSQMSGLSSTKSLPEFIQSSNNYSNEQADVSKEGILSESSIKSGRESHASQVSKSEKNLKIETSCAQQTNLSESTDYRLQASSVDVNENNLVSQDSVNQNDIKNSEVAYNINIQNNDIHVSNICPDTNESVNRILKSRSITELTEQEVNEEANESKEGMRLLHSGEQNYGLRKRQCPGTFIIHIDTPKCDTDTSSTELQNHASLESSASGGYSDLLSTPWSGETVDHATNHSAAVTISKARTNVSTDNLLGNIVEGKEYSADKRKKRPSTYLLESSVKAAPQNETDKIKLSKDIGEMKCISKDSCYPNSVTNAEHCHTVENITQYVDQEVVDKQSVCTVQKHECTSTETGEVLPGTAATTEEQSSAVLEDSKNKYCEMNQIGISMSESSLPMNPEISPDLVSEQTETNNLFTLNVKDTCTEEQAKEEDTVYVTNRIRNKLERKRPQTYTLGSSAEVSKKKVCNEREIMMDDASVDKLLERKGLKESAAANYLSSSMPSINQELVLNPFKLKRQFSKPESQKGVSRTSATQPPILQRLDKLYSFMSKSLTKLNELQRSGSGIIIHIDDERQEHEIMVRKRIGSSNSDGIETVNEIEEDQIEKTSKTNKEQVSLTVGESQHSDNVDDKEAVAYPNAVINTGTSQEDVGVKRSGTYTLEEGSELPTREKANVNETEFHSVQLIKLHTGTKREPLKDITRHAVKKKPCSISVGGSSSKSVSNRKARKG